jgi:hypothetical protein
MLIVAIVLGVVSGISHHEAVRAETALAAEIAAGKAEEQAKLHFWRRLSIGMAAASALLALWSVSGKIATVWEWLGSDVGIGIVVVIGLIGGYATFNLFVRGATYRLEGKYLIALAFTADVGLIIGGWKAFEASGGAMLSDALDGSGRVASGQAASQAVAAAHKASHSSGTAEWAVAAVVIAFLIVGALIWRTHKRHRKEQRLALGAGRAPSMGLGR